jgi:uncharacterized metal-binding protein
MSAFTNTNLVVAIHNSYLMGAIDLTQYARFIRRVRTLDDCVRECNETAQQLEVLRREYEITLEDIKKEISYDSFR